MDNALSIAEVYHEATKYSPEGFQLRLPADMRPPEPGVYKEYPGHHQLALAVPAELVSGDGLEPSAAGAMSDKDISALAFLTNGETGGIEIPPPFPGGPTQRRGLRAAPSAGARYPTELYLGIGAEVRGVEPGLYNYDVQKHGLTRLSEGSPLPGLAAATRCPRLFAAADVIAILTGVFERSAWRYQDRGYRRVLLDTGHVLGNLALAAEALGLEAIVAGGFSDDRLGAALLLDHHHEGFLALVAIGAAERFEPFARPQPSQLSLASSKEELGSPNTSMMRALHRAGRIGDRLAPGPRFDVPAAERARLRPRFSGPGRALPESPLGWGGKVAETILRRRSTRKLSGSLELGELAALIRGAHEREGLIAPDILDTYLLVLDVSGLEAGAYRYEVAAGRLRMIRPGDLREQAYACCLNQELARDAAALVIHTAHLPRAVTRYGDRGYRYIHLDAGHIGQRMNLAAVHLGLGVSGIGGFFDDQLNVVLDLGDREAIAYITALGRAAAETEDEDEEA